MCKNIRSATLQRTIQIGLTILLTGCASSIDAWKDVEKATLLAQDRTTVLIQTEIDWNPSMSLTRNAAISYAIMHDAHLHNDFAIIVQRRGEIAQAELPPNPTFSGAFGVAIDGLSGAPLIMQGMQGLSWLWTRPDRIAAAEQTLQQAVLRAAHRTITIVAEVRAAYAEVSFNKAQLKIAKQKIALANKRYEITSQLEKAGEASALEIDDATTVVNKSKRNELAKETALRLSYLKLLRTMGCPDQLDSFMITDVYDVDSFNTYDELQLLELAVANRLDLATKRAAVQQRYSELGLANPPLLSGSVGFNENFADRQALTLGGSITIALDGDAKEAIANSKLQQAEFAYIDAMRTAQYEVRSALELFNTAKEQTEVIDAELIHALTSKMQRANSAFQNGELQPLLHIDVQQELLAAHSLVIEDTRLLTLSAIQLEFAVGGTFQSLHQ